MNDQNANAAPESRAEHEPMKGLLLRLAWLPIPLLLGAIIAARVAGLSESYQNHTLTLVLSFTFYTLVALGTIFLIGRSFLASGTPGLLLLECGVILWSLAGTVGDAVSNGDANINVTIFNTSILLAGVCNLAGAIFSLRPQRALRTAPLWLGAACSLSLVALWLVTRAALFHWLPVFFIPGQGGTPVRYFVLISAISMFVLSAVLLLSSQHRTHPLFTSLFALALLSLAVGLFGVMIQLSLGSVVNWLGRTAQWLGGFYLFLAAIAASRGSSLVLLPSKEQSRPMLYRYSVAVVVVIAAAAMRQVFFPALGTQAPFVTFYPAVILAALYGGLRSGLLSTVLSAILVDYFWIEPIGQFSTSQTSDWLALSVFIASCVMISIVIKTMHGARTRASVAETQALLATERKEAQEKLMEIQAKLEAALFSMTDAVFISDEKGRFIEFNSAFATFHKFKNKDECYKTLNEYPDLIDVFLADGKLAPLDMWAVPRALRGETVMNAVYTLRRKDTGETWVGSYSFGPIYDKDGMIVGSVVVCRDITEQKRSEEALRISEANLRGILDATLESIWLFSTDGVVLLANPTALARMGKSKEDIIGKRINEILQPEVAKTRLEKLSKVAESGPPLEFNDERSGLQFIHNFYPVLNPEGRVVSVISFSRDITESKRTEEKLRENERLLQDVIDGSTSPIFLKDVDGKFITINASLERMLGKSREEIKGKTDYDISPKEIADSWRTNDKKVMATGKAIQIEEVADLQDGHHIFLSNKFPLVDAYGQVYGVGAISHDITERKSIEEALRESEEKYRNLVKYAPAAIYEMNLEGTKFISVNDVLCDILGYTREELLSMKPADLLDLESQSLFMERIKNKLAGKRIDETVEYRIRRKDGEFIYTAISAGTYTYTNEKSPRVAVIAYDITERKQTQEKVANLTKLYAMLSRVDEAIIRVHDEKALYNEACRIVCEEGRFPLVWIGERCESRVVPVASFGPFEAYLNEISVEVKGPLGQGPTGTAIREDRSVINDDFDTNTATVPWKESALRYGFRASAAVPLHRGGQVIGALTIYSTVQGAFDAEQVWLLETLGSDISYALDSLMQERLLVESTQQLSQTLELLNVVTEGTEVIIAAVDADLCYTYFNAAYQEEIKRLTGRDIRIGTSMVDEFAHMPEQQMILMQEWSQPLRGESTNKTIDFGDPGRHHRIYNVLHTPIRDVQGNVVGAGEVALDITERKLAEMELQRLNETLEQQVTERTAKVQQLADQLRALNAELSRSEQRERKRMAMVLHDHIQQLLVAAKIQLEVIKYADMTTIQSSAQGIQSIITEAIEASRSLTVDLSPPVLHQAGLAAALEWLAERLEKNNLFKVHIRANQDDEPSDESVRFLLFESVRELLLNAIKHSGVHEAYVTMTRTPERWTKITVEDRGAGFDPDTLKSPKSGTFGIFSIQQRFTYIGGHIEIESALGHGTRVILWASPDQPKEEAAETSAAAQAIGGKGLISLGKKGDKIFVLLADDHKIMRQGLISILQFQSDMEVIGEATDGWEAVQLTRKLHPDVVVMDINMPVMNGIEATHIITKELPHVKVIGLSTHIEQEVATAMQKAGAVGYITKGGPFEDLIEAIRACMERK